MISLHLKILEKNDKKEFAVIPYEEFVKIQEELDDYESLKALREAKSKETKYAFIRMGFRESKKEYKNSQCIFR
jgi:hypothetical protein